MSSRLPIFAAIFACADATTYYGGTVAAVFPTPTTTNLEAECSAGFSIGGGPDAAGQAASWGILAPCRLHCECVAKDGTCKYCCKKTNSGCERHLPLYKYATGKCLTCKAGQWLHEAGLSGSIGTSSVDANVKWVARGSYYSHDLVANAAGHRFAYYSGFVACWGNNGGGNTAHVATSCTAFETPTVKAGHAPVGDATDYVAAHLSPVLNQGGCGNCYIQAAMATTTDRALQKMSASQQNDWKTNARSLSTGSTTRCHYAAGQGDACDGGDVGQVMKQLAGVAASTKLPGMSGVHTCTGGVYGGPEATTSAAKGSVDYLSKFAYGCVKGCTTFQAGFAGPPLPSGVSCPNGYTDDQETMKAGFLKTAADIKANFHQFSSSCGCGGTLKSVAGACQYCGAKNLKDGYFYPFGKWGTITKANCNYAGVSKMFNIPAESEFTTFAMTGDEIMAWPGVSHSSKMYALKSLNCAVSPPTIEFAKAGTKCSKCCIPRPYPKAGYQYSARTKAAQAPKQCSGAGVTAGSSPGAATCSVGKCEAKCEAGTASAQTTQLKFDDAAHQSYTPIGMMYGDTGAKDWNPMFEHFIKDEVKQHGPVGVGFTVMSNFGSFFRASPKGIMSVTKDEVLHAHGGHAVSIVGWGVDGGKKYWLVRNSWGRDWADAGFFRMEIGGQTAQRLGFGTNKGSIAANSAVLKTGNFGARRLRTDDDEEAQERRLASVTKNKTTMTPQKHGGAVACDDGHKAEITALRTWFLSNKSNYNGVSSSCATPWKFVDHSGCTAKIAQGLHLQTTLHVEDCNNKTYHMTVLMSYDQVNVTTGAKVLSNSGPEVVQQDPVDSDGGKPVKIATSSALRSGANFVAALLAIAQITK